METVANQHIDKTSQRNVEILDSLWIELKLKAVRNGRPLRHELQEAIKSHIGEQGQSATEHNSQSA